MDQPPAVAFTAFADAWPRAIETEIGAALIAIGRGKDFGFLNLTSGLALFLIYSFVSPNFRLVFL